MNVFEFVVIIVGMGMLANVLRAKYGVTRDKWGNETRADTGSAQAENEALHGEVRTLKERIQVLERLATEDQPAQRLDREIERLRDKQ